MRKVYITEKPAAGSASLQYRQLAARRTDFVTNKRWPAGVWVDMHGSCDGRPLKEYLISQIQLSCRICDPSGVHEEFENFKEMREHLRTAHNGSTVCSVCYQVASSTQERMGRLKVPDSRRIDFFRVNWRSLTTRKNSRNMSIAIRGASTVGIAILARMSSITT